MVPVRHIAATISLLLAFLGCAGADAGRTLAEPWQAIVDTVGDTIVVRTVEGSTWGGSGRLVEEIRVGTRDGADHEMFGRVRALAVTPAGEILVYDAQVPRSGGSVPMALTWARSVAPARARGSTATLRGWSSSTMGASS